MAFLVRTLACTFHSGHHIEPHAHRWPQLIYAATGAMRVRADDMLWIVPPARAVWAPAGAHHAIRAAGDVAMRTLYLDPALATGLPDRCVAIDISPLLRELILHSVAIGMLDDGDPRHIRLAGVVADLLAAAPTLPLALRLPVDPRALRLAERLRDEPACTLDLGDLAVWAGTSVRTIQRLFLAETGLRFAEWRQRIRLLRAAEVLGAGASVTEAGFEAGYAGTSAFIAAFRKQFGQTPTQMR